MKSLVTKLVALICIVLLVVCGSLGIISYYLSSKAVTNEVNKAMEMQAKEGAMIVNAEINSQYNDLGAMANNPRIMDMSVPMPEKMVLLVSNAKRAGHIRMGIADLNGNLSSSNGAVSKISDRAYFKSAAAGTPAVSDPIISKVDGSVIIIFAVPITSNGKVNGVLVSVRDGNCLSDITDKLAFGKSGQAYMINNIGTAIANADREKVKAMDNTIENVKKNAALAGMLEVQKKMMAGETGVGTYSYNGVAKYMGYAPVEGTTWSLAVTAPKSEVMSGVNSLRNAILVVSIILLLIGIGISALYARRMIRPLKNAVEKIQEVAAGNLAIDKINVTSKDEIGVLGIAINEMLDGLRSLIESVSGMVEQVSASSEELTASAEQQAQAANEVSSVIMNMAQGAEKEALAVDGISSAVEESSAMMEQMAANSNIVAQQTNKTASAAASGHIEVERAVNQMKSIGDVSVKLQNAVNRLAQSSREIDEITGVISGIAGQTNLLALNAAIEAARAGEQGKGFAVVAEEVRKLAEQSETAAKQIADLITQNQVNIDDAVNAMEASGRNIEVGIDVVNQAGQSFQEINNLTNEVSSQIKDMSVAVQQMAQGSQSIVNLVKELDNISKESLNSTQTVSAASEEQTASVEEIASASQVLASMAENLQQNINKFRL